MIRECMKIGKPRLAVALGLLVAAAALLAAPARATAQNLFVSIYANDSSNSVIDELLGGVGTPTSYAAGLGGPIGLAFDSHGNLFAGDSGNGNLVEFAPGNPGGGPGTAVTPDDAIYYTYGVAIDRNNNVYVATQNPAVVTAAPPNFNLSTFVTTAANTHPIGVTCDSSGDLWVGIEGQSAGQGFINEYSPSGSLIKTFATGLTTPAGMIFNSQGDIFVADYGLLGNGTNIYEFPPNYVSGSPLPVFVGGLDDPIGLALNGKGDLFESNFGNGTINEYSPTGTFMATVATGLDEPAFLAFGPIVPEPATWLLATLGAGGLWFARRRRRRSDVDVSSPLR
jgi:hypothetical protein